MTEEQTPPAITIPLSFGTDWLPFNTVDFTPDQLRRIHLDPDKKPTKLTKTYDLFGSPLKIDFTFHQNMSQHTIDAILQAIEATIGSVSDSAQHQIDSLEQPPDSETKTNIRLYLLLLFLIGRAGEYGAFRNFHTVHIEAIERQVQKESPHPQTIHDALIGKRK